MKFSTLFSCKFGGPCPQLVDSVSELQTMCTSGHRNGAYCKFGHEFWTCVHGACVCKTESSSAEYITHSDVHALCNDKNCRYFTLAWYTQTFYYVDAKSLSLIYITTDWLTIADGANIHILVNPAGLQMIFSIFFVYSTKPIEPPRSSIYPYDCITVLIIFKLQQSQCRPHDPAIKKCKFYHSILYRLHN